MSQQDLPGQRVRVRVGMPILCQGNGAAGRQGSGHRVPDRLSSRGRSLLDRSIDRFMPTCRTRDGVGVGTGPIGGYDFDTTTTTTKASSPRSTNRPSASTAPPIGGARAPAHFSARKVRAPMISERCAVLARPSSASGRSSTNVVRARRCHSRHACRCRRRRRRRRCCEGTPRAPRRFLRCPPGSLSSLELPLPRKSRNPCSSSQWSLFCLPDRRNLS
jgi:hypothetical protein